MSARVTKRAARSRSVLIVLSVALLPIACGGSNSGTPRSSAKLPLNTQRAPWPDPDRVPDRVAAAGLSGSSVEILTVHYHAHLDIFVNGVSEPVAASIGRDDNRFFSPLHTHATSGLIHIEAGEDQRITLGMLFTEWGVRLDAGCVGGYCRPATPVAAYVNGEPVRTPLPSIVLTKGEEIALVIGSPPSEIPSGWDCRAKIDPDVEALFQCEDFGQ